jgi:hypothetical protein
MKFRDMRAADADRTKKGNLRKNAKALLDKATGEGMPPATPAHASTGVRGDWNGANWQYRIRGMLPPPPHFGVQPLRSRIQRQTRKRRTGGVR